MASAPPPSLVSSGEYSADATWQQWVVGGWWVPWLVRYSVSEGCRRSAGALRRGEHLPVVRDRLLLHGVRVADVAQRQLVERQIVAARQGALELARPHRDRAAHGVPVHADVHA